MAHTLISYSRTTRPLAARICKALIASGESVWLDTQGILPAEPWGPRVRQAILDSHAVVFLLGPDWLKSAVCQEECLYAVENQKKLIPVVVEDYGEEAWKRDVVNDPDLGARIPKELAARNYIWVRDRQIEDVGRDIVKAVRLDLAWIELTLELQRRATAWNESERRYGHLRGEELLGFLRQTTDEQDRDPPLVPLQREFLLASQELQTREEAKWRGLHLTTRSRELAAAARRYVETEPSMAMLLAGHSAGLARTRESAAVLLEVLTRYGNLKTIFHDHRYAIRGLAFHGSQPWLAACEQSGALVPDDVAHSERLLIRDVESSTLIDDKDFRQGFLDCAWSGDSLAAAVQDQTHVYRYDYFRERLRSRFAFPVPTRRIAVSPNGEFLATKDDYGTLGLCRLADGAGFSICTTDSPSSRSLQDVTWLDDETLITLEDGRLKLRKLAQPDVMCHPPDWDDLEQVTAIAAVPDRWIAVAEGSLLVFEPAGMRRMSIESVPLFDGCLALANDGRKAWIGGGGGKVLGPALVEIDLDSATCTTLLSGYENSVTRIAASPDGRYLAAGRSDGEILVWSRDADNDLVEGFPVRSGTVGVILSVECGAPATISEDGTVCSPDGQIVVEHPGPIVSSARLPVGDGLLLQVKDDVRIINPVTGVQLASVEDTGTLGIACDAALWSLFSEDGLRVYDGDGKLIRRWTLQSVTGVAIHGGSRRIATARETLGCQIELRSLDDEACLELAMLNSSLSVPIPMAFSSDGRWLAVASEMDIHLFDLNSPDPVQSGMQLGGAENPIRALTFQREENGSLATLSAGFENPNYDDIMLWWPGATEPIGRVVVRAKLRSLDFSPNGRELLGLTCDGDRLIKVDVDLASWIRRARQKANRQLTERELRAFHITQEELETAGVIDRH